jgi:chemotaxis protein MotA
MKIIFGTVIIILGFALSLWELDQQLSSYWDLVAFAMVFSGTLSVAILTSPSHRYQSVLHTLAYFFKSKEGLRQNIVKDAIHFVEGQYQNNTTRQDIHHKLFKEGEELLMLGLPAEKVELILGGRLHKWIEDKMKVVNWIRSLAKYPPAFGLAATVLGLIQVMNGLSEDADPRSTALKMALALVATFYGIIVANLIVAPIGDRLRSNVLEEYHLAEIAMKAVNLTAQKESRVLAKEILSAHLHDYERTYFFEKAAA